MGGARTSGGRLCLVVFGSRGGRRAFKLALGQSSAVVVEYNVTGVFNEVAIGEGAVKCTECVATVVVVVLA